MDFMFIFVMIFILSKSFVLFVIEGGSLDLISWKEKIKNYK